MELSAWPAPFAGQPALAIALVVAAYVFGFYIRGAFGFGSNLPIVVVSAWVLGPHQTVLLAATVAAIMQLQLLPQGVRGAHWPRVWPVVVAMTAGNVVGVWLLTVLSPRWLLLVLGFIVAALVLVDRLRLLERLGRRLDVRSPRTAAAVASVSAVLGTVSGGGAVYLLVPFLKLAAASPLEFRSTNIMIGGLAMLGRIVMLSVAGLITLELLVDAVALLPAVVLGTLAGTRFFRATSPERFFGALQLVLLLAALLLMGKGVWALL